MIKTRVFFWVCLWSIGCILPGYADKIAIIQELKSCGDYILNIKKGSVSKGIPPDTCPLIRRFFLWKTLQKPEYPYPLNQFIDFLKTHKNWPSLKRIQERGEKVAMLSKEDRDVLEWFDLSPPLSGEAAAFHIKVLERQNQSQKARELIPIYWQTRIFYSDTAEAGFLKKYAKYITREDHHKRLMLFGIKSKSDMLKRMMKYASNDYKKVIKAVLTMIENSSIPSRLLNQIRKDLRDHPLIVFHRIQAHLKNGNIHKATILMQYAISQQMTEIHDKKWMSARVRLAREACQKNLYKVAYALLKDNDLKEGTAAADAYFLAGWISLRKLGKPDQALKHFKTFYEIAKTPISQAKAAYWCGRTLDAKNDHEGAIYWYLISAHHGGTFYGQESRKILGHEKHPVLKESSEYTSWEKLDQPEIIEHFALLHLLNAYGCEQDKILFLTHLSGMVSTLSAQEELLKIIKKVSPRHLVLMSKMAGKNRTLLFHEAYPRRENLFKKKDYNEKLTSALFHSIIRQESGFDEQAISPAGAKGLMQLMPAVAKEIAKKMKIHYHEDDLTRKPDKNALIGTEFLSKLLDRFNGDIVLAIASYNAGEGRIRKWIKEFGDPRKEEVDTIDWIEMIPFEETRSYVHRVLEAIPLYEHGLNS